jgi:hypothetical protein
VSWSGASVGVLCRIAWPRYVLSVGCCVLLLRNIHALASPELGTAFELADTVVFRVAPRARRFSVGGSTMPPFRSVVTSRTLRHGW